MSVLLDCCFFGVPAAVPLILAAIVSWLFWSFYMRKWENVPPGPYGLPLVGYAPLLGRDPYIKFFGMSRKYGDVLSVNIAGTPMVILNSYDAIRDCFLSKGDHFAGRPPGAKSFFRWLSDGMSISQDEGDTWREHRRFSLHTMRDFGFGKISLEGRIQEIGKDLVSSLEAAVGGLYDPFSMLSNCTLNVILSLACDRHFKPDHPDFISLRDGLRQIFHKLAGISAMFDTRIIRWNKNSDFSEFADIKKSHHDICWRFVKEHEEAFDEDNPKDFIDVFLAEIKAAEREGRKDSTFTRTRLKSIVHNFLVAGSETTSNTLHWAVKILSQRPEIQEKIQKELDQIVGRERMPSMLDRPQMPYTEAFTLELLRFTTLTPLGLAHSNPETTTIGSYKIPARSVIFANLWAVNNDPEFWTKPDQFDPERFMDPELKNQRRQRVLSFSIGKRSCLGESLARMELFLFLTMMLQQYSFRPPEGEDSEYKLQDTFIRILNPYQVVVERRT